MKAEAVSYSDHLPLVIDANMNMANNVVDENRNLPTKFRWHPVIKEAFNAIVDVRLAEINTPNLRATTSQHQQLWSFYV